MSKIPSEKLTDELLFHNHEIMKEWDYSLNKSLDPSQVSIGSSISVNWVCKKDSSHKWKTSVYNRIKKNSGCPYCAGQRATKENNLELNNPKIASEWHPSLNNGLLPKDFMSGSNKKVWWQCSSDQSHAWQASISNRTKGRGCPYCSNKKVHPSNCVAKTHPHLCNEWHNELNKFTPSDVMHGSAKKVWWRCTIDNSHVWEAQIRHRAKLNLGCPYCSNHRLSKSNNLASAFPELLKEWHPTLNEEINPKKIISGSKQVVWWQCKHGHVWKATCDSRTSGGTNCPQCTNQTSAPEIRILTELKSIFSTVQSRFKINNREIDIYLPDYKLGVEYDGAYWHKNKHDKDREKNNFFLSKGINLIRVREKPLKKVFEWDLCVESRELTKQDVNNLINTITKLSNDKSINTHEYIEQENFVNNEIYNKYLSYLPDPFPENSLETKSPKIAAQWHFEKNYPLTPKNFSNSSNKKVWWQCQQNKDHVWHASVNARTTTSGNCPFCNRTRVSSDNSLLSTHPLIANEWHPFKNKELKPDKFLSGSSKVVWWQCKKNSKHEWQAAITSRVSNNSSCPYCNGRKCLPENSIEATHPSLAKEFLHEKNKPHLAKQLIAGSNKKVWWKCSKCSYEYKSQVASRAKRGTGCRVCAGLILTKSKFINKAKEKYGDKYDYSLSKIINQNTKVIIICKKHGEFEQSPRNHFRSPGCAACVRENRKKHAT